MAQQKRTGKIVLRWVISLMAFVVAIPLGITACDRVASMLLSSIHLPVPELNFSARQDTGTREAFASSVPEEKARKTHAVQIYEVSGLSIRDTTAYVAGNPAETDSDPCISSDGSDICRDMALGEKVCAANFVPLGTRLYIEGFGICTVKDRLNPRYKSRVDVAMRSHHKKKAVTWGKKDMLVKVLK